MEKTQNKELSFLENIKIFSDVTKTLFFIIGCVLIGFLVIWLQESGNKTIAVLWSLACLASGGIIGFLFGIPRVLQDNPTIAVNNNQSASSADGTTNNGNNNETNANTPIAYRIMVNTNLEQISDWLTKIIVGLGLIELRNVPEYLNSLSGFFGLGLGGTIQAQSLASAIIVYFVIVGFLGVYLMTRIYLAQVFSKADRETQQTAQFGDQKLTLQEFGEQVLKKVNDVEDQVISGQPSTIAPTGETLEERIVSGEKLKVKSILWVDDRPKKIALEVDKLTKLGIKVVQTTSTAEALKYLEKEKFDRIISDMVRPENGINNPRAGIDFIKLVRDKGYQTPIIIYCGSSVVAQYKEEAKAAGAEEITSSSTILMKTLHIEG